MKETWSRSSRSGVKKDTTEGPSFPAMSTASFDPEQTLNALSATTERPPRFAEGFPTHIDAEDVSFKLAGAGGDGAQTAAMILTRGAINEGFDATHIPSYGPSPVAGPLRRRSCRLERGDVPRRTASLMCSWRSTPPALPSSARPCIPRG